MVRNGQFSASFVKSDDVLAGGLLRFHEHVNQCANHVWHKMEIIFFLIGLFIKKWPLAFIKHVSSPMLNELSGSRINMPGALYVLHFFILMRPLQASCIIQHLNDTI